MPARPERPARPAVLLVEDNDLLRRACTMVLQQAQYVVLSASDGERALELLSDLAAPPDALIVDMRLPDMNGTAFVERAALPVAVLYVSADSRALAEARRVARPNDAVLAKPFSADELRTRVDELLDCEIDPEPDVA